MHLRFIFNTANMSSWAQQSAEAGIAGLTPEEAAVGAMFDRLSTNEDPLLAVSTHSRFNTNTV